MFPDPVPVVGAYPGDELSCAAIGFDPTYVELIRNSTVLTKRENTVRMELFDLGGNYSCVATNKYGTDTRVIPVIFAGKLLLWHR